MVTRLQGDVSVWPEGIQSVEVAVTTDDQALFSLMHGLAGVSMWRERLINVENFTGKWGLCIGFNIM